MIIGLSGYARSGKDTVAELLCLNYGYKRVSFADPIRDAVYSLNPMLESGRVAELVDEYGWDVAKSNPEVRRLLQVFGTEVGRQRFGENFWVQQAFDKIQSTKVVFTDVRFPNEAREIQQYGGQVWRINRHNQSPVNGHESEHAMDNVMFKHVLYNDGSLAELTQDVTMLAEQLNL
jgi:hypothetical protein